MYKNPEKNMEKRMQIILFRISEDIDTRVSVMEPSWHCSPKAILSVQAHLSPS